MASKIKNAHDDDDDVFIKFPGLPGRVTLCDYEYKSHNVVDSTSVVVGSRGDSLEINFCPGRFKTCLLFKIRSLLS